MVPAARTIAAVKAGNERDFGVILPILTLSSEVFQGLFSYNIG